MTKPVDLMPPTEDPIDEKPDLLRDAVLRLTLENTKHLQTLRRDRLLAAALTGLLANPDCSEFPKEEVASAAQQWADAVLDAEPRHTAEKEGGA